MDDNVYYLACLHIDRKAVSRLPNNFRCDCFRETAPNPSIRPARIDDSPILVQAAVPVLADDDEQSLAARVLTAEHQAYPLALTLIAQGRVGVEGNRALIDGGAIDAALMMNPQA